MGRPRNIRAGPDFPFDRPFDHQSPTLDPNRTRRVLGWPYEAI